MSSNKITPYFIFIIILTLGIYFEPNISYSQSLISPIKVRNKQKTDDNPPTTEGGGGRVRPNPPVRRGEIDNSNRGASCISDQTKIIPLLPRDQKEQRLYGFTVSPNPTLLVYIPKTTVAEGRLIVKNQQNRVIIRESFPLSEQAGIVTLNLPLSDKLALKPNQWYQWFVQIVCDQEQPDDNTTSETGWIQYIQPSPEFSQQIANSTPEEAYAIYAKEEFWYETVSSLAELRLLHPDDSNAEKQWQELLQSLKLEEDLSNQPLLNCCQIEK